MYFFYRALQQNFVVDCQYNIVNLTQRMTQKIVRYGLANILGCQTRPEPGTGPFGSILRRFPRAFCVANAISFEPCMGIT